MNVCAVSAHAIESPCVSGRRADVRFPATLYEVRPLKFHSSAAGASAVQTWMQRLLANRALQSDGCVA
jgi:hypothetical protein